MLFDEIAIAFFEELKKEDWQAYPSYVEFTNAHWGKYKKLREDFCSKYDIHLYDNIAHLQNATIMYINYKYAIQGRGQSSI